MSDRGEASPGWTRRGPIGWIRDVVRRAAELPSWTSSIRFRLTAIYSLLLFGLAAMVVGGIYLGLASELHNETARDGNVQLVVRHPDGTIDASAPRSLAEVQQRANDQALDTLRTTSTLALAILFMASLLLGSVVAGRVLAPIGRITNVAREIQATDLSRRIGLTGPEDELRELADTFDRMLARLDEAFEGQRHFIHEASHELRNPLAVIRTNLDVVLGDPEADKEELQQVGAVVLRSAERMSRLVDDLLVYADRGSAVERHAVLDVARVVEASALEFRIPAEARGLTLETSAPDGLWVMGDATALRRMLANLLANAIRLGPPESAIRVSAARSGSWVWLAVDDAGPGIPVAERDAVFQRFWRGDPGNARAEGRSGLGLTIVRQIVESHRGSIRLWPSERGGSTFVVWLPATTADGSAPA